MTFNYLLSERKFRGTLSIDHNKSLLDIHVSTVSGLLQGVANVSRFNLILWNAVEMAGRRRRFLVVRNRTPLCVSCCHSGMPWAHQSAASTSCKYYSYFLMISANFSSDVFMDSVNRERSMHMIIQAARRSIGRQFIFITPQSMNNVTQTSDVKIIKMNDPERGQTALNMHRS